MMRQIQALAPGAETSQREAHIVLEERPASHALEEGRIVPSTAGYLRPVLTKPQRDPKESSCLDLILPSKI